MRLGKSGQVSQGATPLGGGARLYAATSSDNSKPSDPLHAHSVSPNPFNIPDSLLYPLTVLRLILRPPLAAQLHA